MDFTLDTNNDKLFFRSVIRLLLVKIITIGALQSITEFREAVNCDVMTDSSYRGSWLSTFDIEESQNSSRHKTD